MRAARDEVIYLAAPRARRSSLQKRTLSVECLRTLREASQSTAGSRDRRREEFPASRLEAPSRCPKRWPQYVEII